MDSSKLGNNTIDVLLKRGENKSMGYAFAYAFMYVSDLCDDYIFEAKEEMKKKFPHLYKHKIKHLINKTYKAQHKLTNMIKVYISDDWDFAIDTLEDFRNKYAHEFFILYNTLLKSSTKRFYADYEMAKIVTRLDVAQLAMTYWQRLDGVVIKRLAAPYNKITCDYDVVIDEIRGSIYRLLKEKEIEPQLKGVKPLTQEESAAYNGAMLNFGKSVANIYKEITDEYIQKSK
jgi:hypothetical protein